MIEGTEGGKFGVAVRRRKGREKHWDTKAEEKSCYGRSHQMALLHIALKVISFGK